VPPGNGICATCATDSDCAGRYCFCPATGVNAGPLSPPCSQGDAGDAGPAGLCLCSGGPYGTGGGTATSVVPSNCNDVCSAGRCRSSFQTTCP
jgi:hypothetical protein